ncbi:MAG: hypothetical protein AAGJ35_13165, partial [Myxococcota bacterium]
AQESSEACQKQCNTLRTQLRIEKTYEKRCISANEPPVVTDKEHWRIRLKERPNLEIRFAVQKHKDNMFIRCFLFKLMWKSKLTAPGGTSRPSPFFSCTHTAEQDETKLSCNGTLNLKIEIAKSFDTQLDIGNVSVRLQGRFNSEQSVEGTFTVEERLPLPKGERFQWSFTGAPEFPIRKRPNDSLDLFCQTCFRDKQMCTSLPL